MPIYLPAFAGRHDGRRIPGRLWSCEQGTPVRQIVDALRHEDPWLAARSVGKDVFLLADPDDPEGDRLHEGREGGWTMDFRGTGSRSLALLLMLRALRDARRLVDLRTGFVSLDSRDLPDGTLEVRGLELHLEALDGSAFRLWTHPVRRILDARPQALAEAHHRALDLWFPLEGVSFGSVTIRKAAVGHTVAVGKRTRLVRPGDPAAIVLSEGPASMDAPEMVAAVRSWFPGGLPAELGLELSSDPLEAGEDWREVDLDSGEAAGLDWEGNPVALGDLVHLALGGETAVRVPRLPPATFHLADLPPEVAGETGALLNQRAAQWHGAALQFSLEPVPGSHPLKLDRRSPLATQPRSPRASGQAAGLLLECVRRAGGDPWRLSIPDGRPTLGLAQGWLYGKAHHLSAALLDASGRLLAGLTLPFRASDLSDAGFARQLARRLGLAELGTVPVVHLDEGFEAPTALFTHLAPELEAWTVRRRSVPRAFGASSFDWLPPDVAAVGPDRALASVGDGDDRRFLSLERVHGQGDPLEALRLALVTEFAWAPGRAERRHGPASLEWARGLLHQRDRFLSFVAP